MYQRAGSLQTRVVSPRGARHHRAMPNENDRRAEFVRFAARQWGCVTVVQFLAAGFTRKQVEGMARRGLLIRLHRGVYVLGALSPAPEQRWAAAVLAAREGRGADAHRRRRATTGCCRPVR